ncbi:MAG: TonB family protein [Bacillota bacterium]|mgnify:FL=1
MRKTHLFFIMAVLCVMTVLPAICSAGTSGIVPDSQESESQLGAGKDSNSQEDEQNETAKSMLPRLIQASRPAYPTEARVKGWEGRVILGITVSEAGSVAAVYVRSSSGYEILDNAAIEAAQKWRFMPVQKSGKPVSSYIAVPISFQLFTPTEIYEVQQKLNDLGFDSGEPDGTMNDRTKTAIMGFQRSKGLEPHGRLDQQTLEALGVVSGKAQSSQDQSTEKQ